LFRRDLSLELISILLISLLFFFYYFHGPLAVIDFDYESDGDRYECVLTQEWHDICLSMFIGWEWDIWDAFARVCVFEGVGVDG